MTEQTIVYHSDQGCRKGCHPVHIVVKDWDGRKKKEVIKSDRRIFSVDEPGAWWDDEWNCHVDGCDYPKASRDECIAWGLYVLGYIKFGEDGTAEG